jgi:hypothetical protein
MRIEAFATGAWLAFLQVALGFALVAGAGASALVFFALTACWLAGGAVAILALRGRSGAPLLVVALGLGVLARLALVAAPFAAHATALGLLAGAAGGGYAGSYLGERSRQSGDTRRVLLHENNGFVAGFLAAGLCLLASVYVVDAIVLGLGGLLLGVRIWYAPPRCDT